jgi:hypothetical protein
LGVGTVSLQAAQVAAAPAATSTPNKKDFEINTFTTWLLKVGGACDPRG